MLEFFSEYVESVRRELQIPGWVPTEIYNSIINFGAIARKVSSTYQSEPPAGLTLSERVQWFEKNRSSTQVTYNFDNPSVKRFKEFLCSPGMETIWIRIRKYAEKKTELIGEFSYVCFEAIFFGDLRNSRLTNDEIKKKFTSRLVRQVNSLVSLLHEFGRPPKKQFEDDDNFERCGNVVHPPRFEQVLNEILFTDPKFATFYDQLLALQAKLSTYLPQQKILHPFNPISIVDIASRGMREVATTDADRLLFIRAMTLFNKYKLHRPGHGLIADLANIVFQTDEVTDEQVRKLAANANNALTSLEKQALKDRSIREV